MHDQNNELKISLHSFGSDGRCLADITLPESGMQVQNLIVMKGAGSGIQVHMPSWMHTRWGYPEISWAEVRQRITDFYRTCSIPVPEDEFRAAFARFDRSVGKQIPETLRTPCFRFYNSAKRTESLVDVTADEGKTIIRDIFLTYDEMETIRVSMPRYMRGIWPHSQIDWVGLQKQIEVHYRALITGEDAPDVDGCTIVIRDQHQVKQCLADIALPGKRSVLIGFRLKDLGEGNVQVFSPGWMKNAWQDKELTWHHLSTMIRTAYLELNAPEPVPMETEPVRRNMSSFEQPVEKTVPTEDSAPAEPPRTNEFGRIQNADSSPFRFVPQTVLRLEKRESGSEKRRNTEELVFALTKGPNGGIGPMEVKIVSWVEKLRYLTTSMLTDLFQGGYISRGWREKVNKDTLNKSIVRLEAFGLVELTRFVAVDERGVVQGTKQSAGRILTLGKMGSAMLHDIGIDTRRYSSFDIYQDGNTVKRYLSANQWLIYWMIHFPEEIGDDYDGARVVYQRGSDMQGARLYATVICNGCPIVAEPVRRVEEFEIKSNRLWLRGKFNRFLEMFSHLDELYTGREELVFPQRPVLVYVCEDDGHIQEVWECISDLATENPDQELWFTSDPRIFSYNMAGQRFMKMTSSGIVPVKLSEWIGTEEKIN